jgi:hypothetical protein
MKKSRFEAVAMAAKALMPSEELATLASENYARGESIVMTVRDQHHPEIVIGRMLVLVLCGSESAIQRAQDALIDVAKSVRQLEGGDDQ